jgi:two-component system, NarL family, sensor histidine kinase UhpB
MKLLPASSKQSVKDSGWRAAISGEVRIVLLFLLFAALWVLLSDRVVEWVAGDVIQSARLQTIKGLLFVAITAGWLFVVLRRSFQKRERAVVFASKACERFELVARASNDAIWDWNLITNEIWWSEGFHNLFGYPVHELEPTIESWTRRLHPEDRERAVDGIHKLIDSGGKTWSDEYRFCCKDGAYVDVYDQGFVIHNPEGKPVRMVGGMMDVTARKRAERQLDLSRRQMRALSARQGAFREEERTRIAREVHDQLGQMLTGLKMDLRWTEKKFAELNGSRPELQELRKKLAEAAELADQTIESVQNIAAELRPSVLDHLGLPMAIKFEVERFHKRTGVTVRLKLIDNVPELKPEVAVAMFRILQEALTNVARHSGATELDIRFSQEENKLVLQVKDNGKGISPEALKSPRSLGLVGMKERASLLTGEVTFESPPGGGTLVKLRVPKEANDTKFWELV